MGGARRFCMRGQALLWEELSVKERSQALGEEPSVIVGGAMRYCGRSHALW